MLLRIARDNLVASTIKLVLSNTRVMEIIILRIMMAMANTNLPTVVITETATVIITLRL